ncbi:unnamed protein product, partial [Allacma fusca]
LKHSVPGCPGRETQYYPIEGCLNSFNFIFKANFDFYLRGIYKYDDWPATPVVSEGYRSV